MDDQLLCLLLYSIRTPTTASYEHFVSGSEICYLKVAYRLQLLYQDCWQNLTLRKTAPVFEKKHFSRTSVYAKKRSRSYSEGEMVSKRRAKRLRITGL